MLLLVLISLTKNRRKYFSKNLQDKPSTFNSNAFHGYEYWQYLFFFKKKAMDFWDLSIFSLLSCSVASL